VVIGEARLLAGQGDEVAFAVGGQLGDAVSDLDCGADVHQVVDRDRGADQRAVLGHQDSGADRAVLIDRRGLRTVVCARDQRREGGRGEHERSGEPWTHDGNLLDDSRIGRTSERLAQVKLSQTQGTHAITPFG
jgi:hypothetical protein